MTSSFETHWVKPALPTILGDRQSLPLPATDHNFSPMVNTFTVPEPLDTDRLKKALALALQLYPLNAAKLAASKNHDTWRLDLANQAIPLTIGFSDRPGPFAADWTGEKDPDYYDELPRGGASLEEYSEITLTKLKVTTWRKTGQTSVMLSQSYNLGDGFALTGFMTDFSDLYQGKPASPQRTFEKFFLPDPHVEPSSSHYDAIKGISWLVVEYNDEFHHTFTKRMEERTSRIDVTFEPWHVKAICEDIKTQSGGKRISTGDAMAGYLADVMRSTVASPPRFIQQCIGFRGQTLHINGSDYHIPWTSLGTCYIIYTLDLLLNGIEDNPAALAKALSASRRELSDPEYVSSVYALYSHLYKRSNFARRLPIDSGHKDAIAINNCVKLTLKHDRAFLDIASSMHQTTAMARRAPLHNPERAIQILREDGAVVLTEFTSLEDLEKVNLDLSHQLTVLPEQPIDFYAAGVETCFFMYGRSRTARETWMLNPDLRKIYRHFLCTKSIPHQAERQEELITEPILNTSVSVNIPPGSEAQLLHRDDMGWQSHRKDCTKTGHDLDAEHGLAVLVPGVDFTDENGATRIIPGSHLWPHERRGRPEDTVPVEMKKGEALVIFGSLVHGGGANRSQESRILHSIFLCRSYLRPEANIFPVFSKEEVQSWSVEAQALAGYRMGPMALGHVDGAHAVDKLASFNNGPRNSPKSIQNGDLKERPYINGKEQNMLQRYVEHGEGTSQQLREESSKQVKRMESRVAVPMQDAVARKMELLRNARTQPIAQDSTEIDSQVYDFELDLWRARMGDRLKMSCNIWKDEGEPCSLSDAEAATLDLYMTRANICDGLDILDLGCGYGPVTFFLAKLFPKSHFTASTMSTRQVEYIEQEASRLGLTNIKAIKADINSQEFAVESFDRIISIEVLEYFTNFERFFTRISRWLKPGGQFFTQFATSKLYCFEATELAAAFTGETFFCSADYLVYAARGLTLQDQWWIPGTHCARSLDAWLKMWQANKASVITLLSKTMAAEAAEKEYRKVEWYCITSAELFRFLDGDFVGMTHYVFEKEDLLVH